MSVFISVLTALLSLYVRHGGCAGPKGHWGCSCSPVIFISLCHSHICRICHDSTKFCKIPKKVFRRTLQNSAFYPTRGCLGYFEPGLGPIQSPNPNKDRDIKWRVLGAYHMWNVNSHCLHLGKYIVYLHFVSYIFQLSNMLVDMLCLLNELSVFIWLSTKKWTR